jgi:prolyl-tRNA editing enzyme YbaK/EbsC (Cys-tRNA(Pro) deacylase)
MTVLSSQDRVASALAAAGIAFDIRTFPAGTRTAQDAAKAIGCSVAEIAKSIVLRAVTSDRAVVVVTSGSNRVDEAKVARQLGEPLAKADADFIRRKTGFAIGGVAPVGHLDTPAVLIDEDLTGFAHVWAAAGTSDSVFRLTPEALQSLTGAPFVDIKQEARP